MFAKQTCHGAKRSMLASSRVMFAPSFGFAQTNGNHLNPCRDRASVQQVASLSASLFAQPFGGEEMNGFSIHR